MRFLLLTVIVFNLLFIVMPKKLTMIELFFTCLFARVLQQVVDLALDLKLDLYGYFLKGIQWRYLIPIFGIYPAVSSIFEFLSIHEECCRKGFVHHWLLHILSRLRANSN